MTLGKKSIMTRMNRKWTFGIGILCGCLTTVLATILWLSPAVTLKKGGEVVFTDYPKGINTVTFENDLVKIWVTDFTNQRDIAFEPNFIATCKDHDYGSMWGMPYEDHYFFLYTNISRGLTSEPPINDVHGTHPLTKARKAQQDAPSNGG